MAYFSNGTDGMAYKAQWCSQCLHRNGCAVLVAHMIHNYGECNRDYSILHILIPRSADKLRNLRCRMFVERGLLSNMAIMKFETEKAARDG